MELGARSIRSSGAGSGSIEVTLPASLRPLLGLSCRLSLRDGLRPEIILQPDLRSAARAFARLWGLLGAGFGVAAGELPLGQAPVALHPLPGSPRLAWTDGLALAGPAPHPPAVLARSLRSLAALLAPLAEVGPALAPGFAAATAWALSGLVAEPEDQQACDITAAALAAEGCRPARLAEDAFADAGWAAAGTALRALLALHQDWTTDPARHAALGLAWRRGVALELSGD